MKKKLVARMLTLALITGLLTGCAGTSKDSAKSVKLDPNNPITLTVWHYYNGTQQAIFDELLDEFNSTVGTEQGIHMEGYSYGSVSDLEQAVTDSINEEVGAKDLPAIFSSYPDTAYSVEQKGKLADISSYFTEDELSAYVDSYIQDGYFDGEDALYLFPVAKSTEMMMINKTDWETFAQATGTSLKELSTTEGVTQVAERYYNWTDSLTPDTPNDGKAFYGRDSMSNYFVIGMKQMGTDIFEVKDGKVRINTDKEKIHRLWENYYVPYMKGYFASYGKFRSDDVKTGDIIAYTGSSSSAFYFPDNVENDTDLYPIEYIMQESPIMEGGENYRVQQGADMAVTKADEKQEYASCLFLKWFTQKEHNLEFVAESSYMPVLKEANDIDVVDQVIKDENLDVNEKSYACLKQVLTDFDDIQFYTSKTCENGYSMRKVLDYNLTDRLAADKEALDAAVASGASREEELAKYISEESFESWYKDFCAALSQAKTK